MSNFTKLYGQLLLTSSVWVGSDRHIKIVWVTMLSLKDERGVVESSVPGLAKLAEVSIAECLEALEKFKAPDPFSRTKEFDGRRIEEIPGGWRILTSDAYRDKRTQRQVDEAERVRRYREEQAAEQRSPLQTNGVTRNVRTRTEPVVRPERIDVDAEVNTDVKETTKSLVEQGSTGEPGKALVRRNGQRGRSVEAIIAGLADAEAKNQGEMRKQDWRASIAEIVFAYWAKRHGHVHALLDAKRERILVARLREGHDNVSELLYVVDGAKKDGHLMGTEPNSTKKYDGIETLFRDRAQVERLANLTQGYRNGAVHPLVQKYHESLGVAQANG